jgi:hypothetical protein
VSHLLLDRGQLLLIELLKLHQDLKTKTRKRREKGQNRVSLGTS